MTTDVCFRVKKAKVYNQTQVTLSKNFVMFVFMKKRDIWISDLTHTATGISAHTFPLGASYVYAYAKQELDKDFNFQLFKFPSDLNVSLLKTSPTKLCFSN